MKSTYIPSGTASQVRRVRAAARRTGTRCPARRRSPEDLREPELDCRIEPSSVHVGAEQGTWGVVAECPRWNQKARDEEQRPPMPNTSPRDHIPSDARIADMAGQQPAPAQHDSGPEPPGIRLERHVEIHSSRAGERRVFQSLWSESLSIAVSAT